MKWIYLIFCSTFVSLLFSQDTKNNIFYSVEETAQFDTSALSVKGEEYIRFGANSAADNQLVNTNVHWIEWEYSIISPNTRTTRYKFSEVEYIFDENTYLELMFNYDELNDDFEGTGRYFREENQRIYEYVRDRDYILYDFGLEDGQIIAIERPSGSEGPPIVISLDSLDPIELETGELRSVIGLDCQQGDPLDYWIDGIGSPYGFLDGYFPCYFDRTTQLRCLYSNDTLVYKNPSIAECWIPSSVSKVNRPEINIWPNPTNNQIHIETKIPFDKVRVFSSIGTPVKEFSGKTTTVAMSDLLSGLYYLQIEQKGQVIAVEKIIKID